MYVEISPRQTGKTTRIANFVIDQLHSVGEVIVTDHTSFEFPESSNTSSIKGLIEKVERLDEVNSPGNRKIEHEIIQLDNLKLMKSNFSGSLLIFNLAIFLILFSLTFICMNLVSVYSAKRELIATTEAALSSSSQHLDSFSYYVGLNRFQNKKKVPINCDI